MRAASVFGRLPVVFPHEEIKKGRDVSSPARALPADIMLFKRIQQENQRQILGKLLHDLRNPVHSIRISMEL